ncbi:MAG: hypothetical protein HYR90_04345 [Candidatus Andersenbacteria bacterium]|nr:hypothetical protein [Candidatus Andersenbacteria bacterium]
MHVVSGLFETFQEADQAVAALNAIGYGTSNISVLGQAEALTSEHHHSEAAEDAGKGAGIGGLIGLLAGAAPFVIPGIGPVIGAGTLIAGALSQERVPLRKSTLFCIATSDASPDHCLLHTFS